MTDTDKIVAAIFAAGMCSSNKKADHATYLKIFDEFIDLLKKRQLTKAAANKKASNKTTPSKPISIYER